MEQVSELHSSFISELSFICMLSDLLEMSFGEI